MGCLVGSAPAKEWPTHSSPPKKNIKKISGKKTNSCFLAQFSIVYSALSKFLQLYSKRFEIVCHFRIYKAVTLRVQTFTVAEGQLG
jgi:hypothetical protein